VRLDFAQLLAQLNKPEQAKPILVDLVKELPKDVQALDSLFRVSAATKDYDTAKSAAEGLIAAEPKGPLGYMYEGILAEQAKRNEDALRLYARAADLQPNALEPLQAQIRLLVAANRTPEALKRLDDVAVKDPANAFAPNIKGEVLMTQKNPEGAREAFNMAIERAPKWFTPYRGLAAAQAAAKDPDAGLATLRKAETTVDPPDQVAVEIASYLERIGKPQEAIHEYEAIVRRDPQSDLAANNLAMLLVTYGKDSASLDRAKSLSARFADSSNPSFLDTYGWVLFKHGETAASVPVLQRVVLKSPDAAVALYHLGMAQSQSGSTTQALDNLTRAVNSGARFSGLDEAKATLDKLGKLTSDASPKT
jgi:tetratricopeptide (TPR) repeat protein